MNERIKLELNGRKPHEVTELNLDNCGAKQIGSDLNSDFKNLESLTFINVGLTTLKGFPKLPSLKKLDLSDNRIVDGWDDMVSSCPNLEKLALSGNGNLRELKDIQVFNKLKGLKNLELFSCPVSLVEEYRKKVFELMPGLVYLDAFDRENKEAPDSDLDDVEDEEEEEADSDEVDEDGDDDDDELDEEEEEEGESGEEDGPGLSALYDENLADDTEEFEANEDDEEDEDLSDEEEGDDEAAGEDDESRGKKRKFEEDKEDKTA